MSDTQDSQMLLWLDVLLEFDPEEDIAVLENLDDEDDLAMHEAAADGQLEDK